MYLIRALPDQIAKHWPLFKFSIASAMPPGNVPTEENLLQILQLLLAGGMQLWIGNEKNSYPVKTIGIATTVLCNDPITRSRSLLLFSAYSWSQMGAKDWEDGFKTLYKYAKAEGCSRIELYTDSEIVQEILTRLGTFTQHTYAVVQLQ